MRIFTIFQQQPYCVISNSAYQPSQEPILPELLWSNGAAAAELALQHQHALG